MRQILFSKPYETSSEYFVKIEHSQVDKEAYERVITANLDGKEPIDINTIKIDEEDDNQNKGKSHKIEQCYKFFYEKLRTEHSEKERESLFNKILDSNNKMLVVIDIVEGKDDEQAIFDTLNTAGIRLTTAEIVKNALYQKIIEKSGRENAINFYKNTWEKTFLSDEETVKYWEREKITGRLKRDNLEILLHSIAIIKGVFDPDKNNLAELSKLYKNEIKNKSKEDLETFVNEIIKYAEIYHDKFPDFDKSTLFLFEDSISRLFHILEELEISTFHPFILYVFKEFNDNDEKIKNILFNLERFVVRRMIARQKQKIITIL
jgi:Protein of unknown function DUF262.